MLVGERRDPSEVLIADDVSIGPQLGDDAVDVDGVPDQHGVGQQTETAGLVHHLLVVADPEGTLIGEEQPFCEDVAELAAIELELDSPAERLLLDVGPV
jgi:hypothetical protein